MSLGGHGRNRPLDGWWWKSFPGRDLTGKTVWRKNGGNRFGERCLVAVEDRGSTLLILSHKVPKITPLSENNRTKQFI